MIAGHRLQAGGPVPLAHRGLSGWHQRAVAWPCWHTSPDSRNHAPVRINDHSPTRTSSDPTAGPRSGRHQEFTVAIPRMTVSKSGRFTGTVSQPDTPFHGTTTLVVQGELTGSTASGTAAAKGEKCGSGSATPNASLYLESFTASAA
jgi:hypothetical protein